jgi:hypothetical protein
MTDEPVDPYEEDGEDVEEEAIYSEEYLRRTLRWETEKWQRQERIAVAGGFAFGVAAGGGVALSATTSLGLSTARHVTTGVALGPDPIQWTG